MSTVDLRKTYLHRGRRRVAVGGLSMTVPAGGVHGFLGPNGSGKMLVFRRRDPSCPRGMALGRAG